MSFGTYMLITDLSCSLKYDILMSFDGFGSVFFVSSHVPSFLIFNSPPPTFDLYVCFCYMKQLYYLGLGQ